MTKTLLKAPIGAPAHFLWKIWNSWNSWSPNRQLTTEHQSHEFNPSKSLQDSIALIGLKFIQANMRGSRVRYHMDHSSIIGVVPLSQFTFLSELPLLLSSDIHLRMYIKNEVKKVSRRACICNRTQCAHIKRISGIEWHSWWLFEIVKSNRKYP